MQVKARSQRGPNELCELQPCAGGGSGLTATRPINHTVYISTSSSILFCTAVRVEAADPENRTFPATFLLPFLVAQKRRCPAGIRRPEKSVPPRHKRAKKQTPVGERHTIQPTVQWPGHALRLSGLCGPQPRPAEARCRSALEQHCNYLVLRRLRPWVKNRTFNLQIQGRSQRGPLAGLRRAWLWPD